MTSISKVLLNATSVLKENNIPNPRLDAEVILSHLLKVDRSFFIVHKEEKMKEDVVVNYQALIDRRALSEPVAYIIGSQEFMGFEFIVDRNVLIPRPDTEILVEFVIDYLKTIKSKHVELIDIGTGSGAIAISIGKNVMECSLTMVDISRDALEMAKRNAKKLGIKNSTTYILSDCFENVEEKRYDIILSNPPYIPSEEILHLQKDVKEYEPKEALDGGDDGLTFYRRIIEQGVSFIVKGGLIAFEIAFNQAEDIVGLLKDNGYKNINILKDLAGLDRVVYGNYGLD